MTTTEADELVEKFRVAALSRDFAYMAGMVVALMERMSQADNPQREWLDGVARRIIGVWKTL